MAEYQHIATADDAGTAVVSFPTGRFDGNAVRELFEFSNQLPTHHPKLLVDCTGVELVPSGAMGMLVTIRKRFFANGGQLHTAVPNAEVRGAFAATNLDRILLLFNSVEAAKSAFKP
jgi:anti-anti-sigma factor